MTRLLDFPLSAMRSRRQKGPCTASSKLFGPAVRLLTEVTWSIARTAAVRRAMLWRYFAEEISREETVRIRFGAEGKRRSTFSDCRKAVSLVEKKKCSSTTGLRSTNIATSKKRPAVSASSNQCKPEAVGLRIFVDIP